MAQRPNGSKPPLNPAPAGVPKPVLAGDSNGPGERSARLLGLGLFLVVLGVFLPCLGHEFITYDDPVYVTQNPHVLGGLTWPDVRWAFQSTEASNWHPVTWLSHMLDCELFGIEPWGHHLDSVLLHAANALFLFWVLRRMTGATWRSLFVAALFGLHPLRVESVAWVSERKDVLSTFFCMLLIWAYIQSAERAKEARPGRLCFLGVALFLFALGLMSKPMLVTVPGVLLLLDYWPLGRWSQASAKSRWGLLAEKAPFIILAAAASAVTLFAQRHGGAVASAAEIPVDVRLEHALISYCRYLGKGFCPSALAVFYPFFGQTPPAWQTWASAGLLAAITAVAFLRRKAMPYLLVGWLWFLGTLVPVIGLVQTGGQSIADRYSYLPLVGIFLMATWAVSDLVAALPYRRALLGTVASVIVLACASLTSYQLTFWKDSTRLFRQALRVTDDNWVAHAALGASLVKSAPAEAQAEFRESARIIAAFAETYNAKGLELEKAPGHTEQAIAEFRKAEKIMPDLPDVHYNLGVALSKRAGGLPEATEEFRAAVRLNPDFVEARYNLGSALLAKPGGEAEALDCFEAVVRLAPQNPQGHFNLGYLLSRIPGRENEAVAQYKQALTLDPSSYQAHFNLGLVLSDIPGRSEEAVAHFQSALKINPTLEKAREMIRRLRPGPP